MALALMAGVRARRGGEHWEGVYWTNLEVPSEITCIYYTVGFTWPLCISPSLFSQYFVEKLRHIHLE